MNGPRASVRIPLRVIDRSYGPGNYDEAGDDIIDALRELYDYPDQYHCQFEFDTAHPNPWYHTLIVSVDGLPHDLQIRWLERITDFGLMEG